MNMTTPEHSFELPGICLQEVGTIGPNRVLALTASLEPPCEYVLADIAIAEETLDVEETSESGRVPQLRVENRKEEHVLILEGDILVGGKQNRMSNSTVVIPAGATLQLPVSCVESDRWNYKSRKFQKPTITSSVDVLRRLKSGKFRRRSHQSDQGAIWEAIENVKRQAGYQARSTNHEDVMRIGRQDVAQFLADNPCPENAVGVAIIVGSLGYVLDLFDKPSTCRHYWNQKIRSAMAVTLDNLGLSPAATSEQLRMELDELSSGHWISVDSVGLGRELRATTRRQSQASVLCVDEHPVHVNVMSRA